MHIRDLAPLIFIVAALCASCAAPAPDDPIDSDDAPPASADAGSGAVLVISEGNRGGGDRGMSVADALGHRATDDLVFVTGALFVDPDGTVLLCDAIAESFPPQCGGARLEVQGLDLSTIDGLEEASGVRWAEGVILFGSVEQRRKVSRRAP
jgi:hypothetical protein